VPTVAAQAEHMRAQVAAWPISAQVLTDPAQKRAAFRAADVALAASGTVSLELAANNTPMVIGYDMSWLTQRIAERLIKLDTVTLVNLVSETRAVPECLGRDCTAENLARHLRALLDDPAQQAAQRDAMRLTMERLGQGGEKPGHRAAASCLAFMARKAGGGPAPAL
ncbi:MAG: lipid-A-disaccharide synthase, partial [Rhodobacteraceae bacterium]|nr:lipid-A-disaccharide synthase [Paracoccaceae bacterium]